MEKVLTDGTCQKWFLKFCVGDFLLDDTPWLGRPVKVDSDQIKTLTENNQCYTTSEIFDIIKISKSSTENHLYQLGYVNCFDGWVPHKQQQQNLLDYISKCDSLLKHNENVPFKKQILTSNEKWILYNNVEWTRSWGKQNEPPPTTPKAGLPSKEGDVIYIVGLEESPLS